MAGNPQTVFIEPADERVHTQEKLAVEAFTPGHLLEVVSGGFQKHSTAAANAQKVFARRKLSDAGDIDTAYVTGETARGGYAKPGDVVYALVAASATAITLGAALESAGDGTLRIQTTDAATDDTQRDSVVAYAAEAVDNSGGGSEARIKIEVA